MSFKNIVYPKIQWLLIRSLIVFITTLSICASAQSPVYFEDIKLKTAVEDALWVYDPTPIDMQGLFELTCSNTINNGVKSLVGLETATNMVSLTLSYNQISSLEPLQTLTQLQTLIVNDNNISDLSPLSNLTQLKKLDIHRNRVTDISSMSGLTALNHLAIRLNDITDISALANLSNLDFMTAQNCRISDISPLSSLTKLTKLQLQGNEVTDISPLKSLNQLEMLLLNDNDIQDITALTQMNNLSLLALHGNALNMSAYTHNLTDILANNSQINLSYSPNIEPPGNLSISVLANPDRVKLTWDAVHHGPFYTSYYQVSRSYEQNGKKIPISAWTQTRLFNDTTITPGITAYYWVRSATSDQGDNHGLYSNPVTNKPVIPPTHTLTLTSTAGGDVFVPGEGDFSVNPGHVIPIEAKTTDPNLFTFSHWTSAGLTLASPHEPSITVSLSQSDTLKAHFTSHLKDLYVDVNTPTKGNGTPQAPFACIQDAIDVAQNNAVIHVTPNTYYQTLDFLGKSILVTGLDPNAPLADFPVIDGNDSDVAISFSSDENATSCLEGFTIQNSRIAVLCDQASPILSHCIIVGNHSNDPNAGAITCLRNSNPLLEHCTITDNLIGIAAIHNQPTLSNSIVWGNEQDVFLIGDPMPISLWNNAPLPDPNETTFHLDPLFVQPGFWIASEDPFLYGSINDPNSTWHLGDYHLQSKTGHWDAFSNSWLLDSMTSLSIDAGHPFDDPNQEPLPNGDLVNLGAYGATGQASKSLMRDVGNNQTRLNGKLGIF